MSFVTNQMFMNSYAATRLNGQYAVQQSNQNRLNMLSNPISLTPNQAHQAEKQITFTSLINWFLVRCSSVAEESLRQQQKENIRTSFDTFA